MIKRTLFFGNPAYLKLRNKQLVVELADQDEVRTIPIEDIGVAVLEHQQITITHGVLAALLENNATVITCDDKYMPSGLLLPLAGNSVQSERFQHQISAKLPLKKQLWQQTMRQKILNQAYVLNKHSAQPYPCMTIWANEVKSGDTANVEARAAAFYWKYLFAAFPNFVREQDGDYPNNFLNYGYAILRAIVARALVSSGLLPTLGIHHHNRYNAYCLADDIMEPYRPYVDELVLDIISSNPEVTELTQDIKAMLLQIPVIDVVIDGKKSPLMVAATQTTASLAKCFLGEETQLSYPKM